VLGPDRMMRVRPGGGQPELITRSAINGRAAWSEDGTILFTPNFGAAIFRVPAAGGDATPVTRLDPEKRESYHGDPRLLPGDGRFLFISRSVADNRNEIRAGSLDGSAPVTIMSADALVGYSKPWLLFVRDGGIYAQRFDAGKLRLEGEPARVVDNAMFSGTDVTASAYLSRDGALTWQAFRDVPTELVAFGRNGATAGNVWKQNNLGNASLSSDEQTLAVGQWDRTKGSPDVSIFDLQRGIATRLTSGLAAFTNPQISPDGGLVAFNSDRDGMFDLYLQATDGSTKDRLLWKDEADKWPSSWSPDGRVLAVRRFSPKTRSDIWLVPVDPPGKPEPWLETEHNEALAVFSPDGNWVAYVSSQSGESELYVRRRTGGRAMRVSTTGGGQSAWSHDGRELLWIASGNRVMSAAIVLAGDEPRIGPPQELFTEPRIWSHNLTIMRDGTILLMVHGVHSERNLPIEYSTAWKSKL
jgi:eukaryotic-like serine/threonine-protein kinase